MWGAGKTPPPAQQFICGAPALPGRSYCTECRKVLVAREHRLTGDEDAARQAHRRMPAPARNGGWR